LAAQTAGTNEYVAAETALTEAQNDLERGNQEVA